MAMTLLELKRELKGALGNRETLDSRLADFVNIAQVRLARSYDFDELIRDHDVTITSTTDSSADRKVPLPDDFKDMRSFLILDSANSRKLEYISARKWDQAIALHEQSLTGRPYKYTIIGKEIILWRIPDQTYDARMRYSRWPKKLVKETDVSDFDHKDDLIILLAQVWAFQNLGELERANHAFSIYRGLLSEAISEEETMADRKISPDVGFQSQSGALADYHRDPFFKG